MISRHHHAPFHVVIPARYASTRLPGKPLRLIGGKTMVRRVFENAIRAGAGEVIVATDDQRIIDEIVTFDGMAMMTADTHRSGTDRIAEVCEVRGWSDETIIVNLQGDEPGIGADLIALVAQALHDHPEAGIATLATPIIEPDDIFNPNAVKVVIDNTGRALYFSRAPIPWVRDEFHAGQTKAERLPSEAIVLRHLGLYAYRVGALRQIAGSPAGTLEKAESLEQLRAMEMGIGIHVTVIDKAPGHGVDTEEDLRRADSLHR